MEISKGLQREIVKVQSELQKAIMEHQIYRNRLETEPNNPDIPGHMKRIQVYITSLGKSQREVVQRLRTEVEAFTADNANGSKVSIAALLGLNNNHITNNNETKHETAANGFETKSSKEDYEEIVRNGDVHHSPVQDSDCTKLPSPSSVETISGEDDVVAVSMDENSDEKQEEEKQKESKMESMGEEDFLSCLGLITQTRYAELQNRRVERKRRSTANSNFVYLTYNQQPSKRRKLYSYFQSENAPHTRQTTARMNGPSPPPNKTQPAKSTSPPAQTVQTKSLIPVQKSTTRPNILRNADSKVFVNKNKMEDNQIRSSVPSAKSIQQISNKAVHIPGLPSSLTIERIENEPAVCICCRNPDSLTICKNCSSNYHVSCHTRSLVPSRTCPRCVLTVDEEEGAEKDEDAEIKRETEAENKLPRYKKNDKLEEKKRERYELRERNSDLRLQVYELEKRSQLLGQSLQLQQRMRQELLGKQEKTQKSIKRLVDFIKLMQLRKSASSPPASSITCQLQPSSSQSAQTVPLLLTPTNQKAVNSPTSTMNNDKKSHLITLPSSSNIHDHHPTSPTSKQTSRCHTPTSCPGPLSSQQKSTNHISSSRKSPNRLEGPISLLAVKPKTKTGPQFSTINCRPVTALPFKPASIPSSQTPCSTIVTNTKSRTSIAQLPSTVPSTYQNCQILLTPSRTTINWTERPSTAESPGPNFPAANSVSISQPDQPQKPYCLSMTTLPRTNQSLSEQQRKKQQQRISTIVASTGRQEPELSSTHCSQAIISPILSPVVNASYESSAQTIETIRSCDSSSAARSTSWSRQPSSQTAGSQQQQSSSSGVPSRGSLST